MKKIVFIFSGILCVLLLTSGRKSAVKSREVTITPERLHLFVDQKTDPYTIQVAYTLNIPMNYIPSCARLVYQPYFLASGHRYDLRPLVISGAKNIRQEKRLEALTGKQPDYPDAMHLKTKGDGMKIKLSEIVPFQVWMAQAKLRADVILETCDRKHEVAVLTLADGIIWFPMGPGPALVKYVKENAVVEKEKEFYFFYPWGEGVYHPDYDGNNRMMERLQGWMDTLQRDTAMHLEKVVITGSSSPAGRLQVNEQLAGQRAESIKKMLAGHNGIRKSLIQVTNIAEDWRGLRLLMEKTGSLPGKREVIRILDEKITDEKRKQLLQQLPQYNFIRYHLFPDLQKVICRFYYTEEEERIKVEPL